MSSALFRTRLLPLLLLALIGSLAAPGLGQDKEKRGEEKKFVEPKKVEEKKVEGPKVEEKKGRKYALIVGVRHYKKDELRSLKYADKDAIALAEALRGAGYRRVVLMTYESAGEDADLLPTARNIKEQLKSLTEDCRRDDSVLVAFFGHGVQFPKSKDHHLCPIDAELSEKETLLPLSEVYKELGKCKAGTKLAFLDACYARPASGGSVRLEARPTPQDVAVPEGVLALFSCSPGQFSFESEKLKQGIFPHFVLKGMAGAAAGKDGAITLNALVSYVRNEVPDAAKDAAGPTARQVPLLRGELSGTVALLSRPVTVEEKAPVMGPPLVQTGPTKASVRNEEGVVRFPTPYAVAPMVMFSNNYFRVVSVTKTEFRWQHLDGTPSTANWTARGNASGNMQVLNGPLSARVQNEEGIVRFTTAFAAPPVVTYSNNFFTTIEVTTTQLRWRHVDTTPSTGVWTARGERRKGK